MECCVNVKQFLACTLRQIGEVMTHILKILSHTIVLHGFNIFEVSSFKAICNVAKFLQSVYYGLSSSKCGRHISNAHKFSLPNND